jgi:hypothetical protein
MPTKNSSKKAKKTPAERLNPKGIARFHGGAGDEIEAADNGHDSFAFTFDHGDYTHPVYPNPETGEARAKRLAARKALTLRAFRSTYENRRGAS